MTPDDIDRMVAAGFSVEELAGAVKCSFFIERERKEQRRRRRAQSNARPHIPPLTNLKGGMCSEVVTHVTRVRIYRDEPAIRFDRPALFQQGRLAL